MDTLDNTDIIDKKGDINYERLSQISDDIMAGRKFLNRLSLAEEQGRTKGGRGNVEASILLSRDHRSNKQKRVNARIGSTGSSNRGNRQDSNREISTSSLSFSPKELVKYAFKDYYSGFDEKQIEYWENEAKDFISGVSNEYYYNFIDAYQELLIEKYAKESGLWINPKEIEKWEYKTQGQEAKIYKDPNNPDCLLKVVYNHKQFTRTLLDFFDRISLYNYFLPQTFYEVVGFTKFYSTVTESQFDSEFGYYKDVEVRKFYFAIIIRQKEIKGQYLAKEDIPLLHSEMKKYGLPYIGHFTFRNKEYNISDAYRKNILIDEDRKIYFIDILIKLNTSKLDGIREYGDGSILSLSKKNGIILYLN